MTLIELAGITVAFLSLSVAIYSRLKQRKVEKRLERKEDMKELASDLESLADSLENLIERINSPDSDLDLWVNLRRIGTTILTVNHSYDKNPDVYIEGVYVYSDNGRQSISTPDGFLQKVKEEKTVPNVIIDFEYAQSLSEFKSTENISEVLYSIPTIYKIIEDIEGGHKVILDEFDRELLETIEMEVDDITLHIANRLLSEESRFQIRSDDFEEHRDITRHVINELMGVQELEEKLNTLSDLISRIQTARRSILEASYS